MGIYIDQHMRWDVHTEYLTKKIRSLLHRFLKFREVFTVEQMRPLYSALVESHLRYSIVAWGGVTNNHLKSLEVAQKWILKIIYKREYTYPTDELFLESAFFDARQLFFAALVFRQHTRQSESFMVIHDYGTKGMINFNLRVPRAKKTVTQRSYYYLGPKIYNLIPLEIRRINAIKLFKKKVLCWIRNKTRNDVHRMIDIKNIYY